MGALWTGLGPNIDAIINAAELASYDQVKQVHVPVADSSSCLAIHVLPYFVHSLFHLVFVVQTILKIPGFSDNVFTHLLSGLGGWLFAVCIGSPVDVVCDPCQSISSLLLLVLI